MHLGYPIGLIPGTKGGIPLSCWDRAEDGAFFDNALELVKAAGSGIKGILWYQGCNDLHSEELRETYLERFKRVCWDFRSSYGEKLPILTVQLNKKYAQRIVILQRKARTGPSFGKHSGKPRRKFRICI